MDSVSDVKEPLFRALGEAVARSWSVLPAAVQQQLFEEAVMSQGEAMRQQLALFLHEKHSRTAASIKARAMPEPDSLGGGADRQRVCCLWFASDCWRSGQDFSGR